jgi:hypothetical protein
MKSLGGEAMHYLVLGCDVAGDEPLRAQFDDAPALPDLPSEISAALLSWNERMAEQIARRVELETLGERLNREGAELAKRVASSIPGGAKVRFLKE